jgi:probable rRNA maturation factor
MVRRVKAMIGALQLKDVEVSILLTDSKRIQELNKVYRHKDRPTDVLAFAMREGDFGTLAGGVLGDVIVSVEVARKQAAERGVTVLDEVTMLTAHGLLHLLGWDHDTPAKDRRMRAETDRLCQAADGSRRTDGRSDRKRQATSSHARQGPVKAAEPEGSVPSARGRRSKATAKRALSRKRGGDQPRKVEAPHRVKPRRSPKG